MSAFIALSLISLTSVSCLDFLKFSDDCLRGNSSRGGFECVTSKGLKVQRIIEDLEKFYCINYEKKTGNANEFDTLTFALFHDDYDLKFIGANVLSDDVKTPKFKLYNTKKRGSYKGKFAFSSENANFEISSVAINGEHQVCLNENRLVWPLLPQNEHEHDVTTAASKTEVIVANSTELCGVMKQIGVESSFPLPSIPGQFPWHVSIHRFFNDDEESYYKCSGTIIGKSTILTSTNCLLEDGLLLQPSDVKIIISPYNLQSKPQSSKIFEADEFITHESFNIHLDYNIAVVRLTREIQFNEFAQPICLPSESFSNGKLGKLAGFGKSSSATAPKYSLLTEAEYELKETTGLTFTAENTSGNLRVSDIGAGLFINETNRWTLAGVMSHKIKSSTAAPTFKFTNVFKFTSWIDKFKDQPNIDERVATRK